MSLYISIKLLNIQLKNINPSTGWQVKADDHSMQSRMPGRLSALMQIPHIQEKILLRLYNIEPHLWYMFKYCIDHFDSTCYLLVKYNTLPKYIVLQSLKYSIMIPFEKSSYHTFFAMKLMWHSGTPMLIPLISK